MHRIYVFTSCLELLQ